MLYLLFFIVGCIPKNKEVTDEPVKIQVNTEESDYNKLYGRPLIIFKIIDPWEWVVGADKPRFVMYQNGQVIYRLKTEEEVKFMEVTLSRQELCELVKTFNISDEFYSLDSFINAAPGRMDLPSYQLIIDIKAKKKCVVYGNMRTKKIRNNAPSAFVNLYDKVVSYQNPKAKEWSPSRYELFLRDNNNAPNKRKWIEGFPDLNSNSTKIIDGNNYIVYIDSFQFKKFIEYFKTIGEDEAVEINGRKMSISYGICFPNIR